MRKYLLLGMMPFWLLIAIWYPSLQPIGGTDEVQNKNTCLTTSRRDCPFVFQG
jgi:hypothetical protein